MSINKNVENDINYVKKRLKRSLLIIFSVTIISIGLYYFIDLDLPFKEFLKPIEIFASFLLMLDLWRLKNSILRLNLVFIFLIISIANIGSYINREHEYSFYFSVVLLTVVLSYFILFPLLLIINFIKRKKEYLHSSISETNE